MKKITFLTLLIFAFLSVFFYLHQKIQFYVEAYKLSQNYSAYKELVDKRDYLVYNFSQEVSLSKVNEWAKDNNFLCAEKEKILALDLDKDQPTNKDKVAFLFDRILSVPAGFSSALAGNRE